MTRAAILAYMLLLVVCPTGRAGEPPLPAVDGVALQPLAAHARALTEAMEYLGTPLPDATRPALDAAYRTPDAAEAARATQAALDPLCLVAVDINPEARVKVAAGPAKPQLIEAGWRTFLVKVHNAAG